MVSLLEKVQLHRSSYRFEPELVMQEINLSHCCIVSTCVRASLTSNCRAATQSSQLMGNEALHKTTNKGQMETENTHYADSWHTFTFTGAGIWRDCSHSGFVSWYVTWSFHRQQWTSYTPNTTGLRYYRQKGMHRNKYRNIQNWNAEIPWPSPRYHRCQWSCTRTLLMIESQSHFPSSALTPIACPTSCITSTAAVKTDKNKTAKQPQHSTRHPANASNLLAYMCNTNFKN